MRPEDAISRAVKICYWEKDVNCAQTTLHALSDMVGLELCPQLWAAATGLHGAGRYGAQCGLVEGMLLFLGVRGAQCGLDDKAVGRLCHAYAGAFTVRFGGLECRILRPGGFSVDDPPHKCEKLTVDALLFAVEFLQAHPEMEVPPSSASNNQ